MALLDEQSPPRTESMCFCKKKYPYFKRNTLKQFWRMTYDVRQRCVISDEIGEKTKQNAGYDLEMRNRSVHDRLQKCERKVFITELKYVEIWIFS